MWSFQYNISSIHPSIVCTHFFSGLQVSARAATLWTGHQSTYYLNMHIFGCVRKPKYKKTTTTKKEHLRFKIDFSVCVVHCHHITHQWTHELLTALPTSNLCSERLQWLPCKIRFLLLLHNNRKWWNDFIMLPVEGKILYNLAWCWILSEPKTV